ncbi:MAG: hypothetical protein J3Q66DRAFT_393198 [Benniella sp.]|nr:MAG: hypothetical protein J3Q66DRAFT_393198 [Benniella sp.]
MTISWFSSMNTITTFVSLFATTFLLQSCQAQKPEFVYGMAYARVGPHLYFNGGNYLTSMGQKALTPQLAALPLNVSWSVHSPPWKLLTPGNAFVHFSAVPTTDSQTLVTILPQSPLAVGKYNIQQDTWRYTSIWTPETIPMGARPVLDPISGGIYIASSTRMNFYDHVTDVWQSQLIPNNTLNQRIYGGAVYNNARKTIMYFGGYSPVFEPETYITEYATSTGTWSIFNTTGDIPPPIADICMVSSEDGNTIAVFGGRYFTTTRFEKADVFSNLLYLLDVPRRVWTKAATVSIRAYTGCQIVGDQFVAWGGADDKENVLPTQPPLVFDLTKKQWVDTYTAPAYYLNSSPPPSNNSNNSTNNSSSSEEPGSKESTSTTSNQRAILGGSLGSASVIALALAFYFYKASNLKKDKLAYRDSRGEGFGQDPVSDDLKRRTQEPQGSPPGPHDLLPSQQFPGPNDYRLPGPHECASGSQERQLGPQNLSSGALKYMPMSLPGPQLYYVPPPAPAYSPSQVPTPPLAFNYYYHDSRSPAIPMATRFTPNNDDPVYAPGIPYPVVVSSSQSSVPIPVTVYPDTKQP